MPEETTEDIVEDPDKKQTTGTEEETPEAKEKREADEKAAEGESPEEKGEKKSEDDEDKSDDKSKRTPRLMEVYKHKIAEKKWNKEKEDLESKITDLAVKAESKSQPEKAKLIKDFAEKSGMDSDLIEEFVKIAESGQSNLSKELSALKAEIKKNSEERVWDEQEKGFEKDYDKNIVSLVEADNIPKESIPRLKKLLKSLAFTEEFAKTRLSVIYKGHDDFKQFHKKGQKSGESSRGGLRGDESKKSWLDLSEEEFEKRIESEAKEAGEGKFNIRRDGKTISG